MEKFDDFLKITQLYKIKKVARNCSNFYLDTRENIYYKRKETTAEHVASSLKLADYFLSSDIEEFKNLNKLKVYDLLLYHDDVEIVTGDVCISNVELRKNKEENEIESIKILINNYPIELGKKLEILDSEYRQNLSAEANFAHAIDKMDALVHELEYPDDWGPKGFTKENVIAWFSKSFEYSPTFKYYFYELIKYLDSNNYF